MAFPLAALLTVSLAAAAPAPSAPAGPSAAPLAEPQPDNGDVEIDELGKLPRPREQAGAVLVSKALYVLGGLNGLAAQASVDVFDLSRRRWSSGPPMRAPRYGFRAVQSGGRIYVLGGWSADGKPTSSVEYLDIAKKEWRKAASMPEAGGTSAVDAWKGKIYVFGLDRGDLGCLNASLEYDSAADSWKPLPRPPTPRCRAGAAYERGKVYLIGGTDLAGLHELAAAEAYDLQRNEWATLPDMPTPRASPNVVAWNGQVFAAGGYARTDESSRGWLKTVQSFDPNEKAWRLQEVLRAPRAGSAIAAGEHIYIVGGRWGDAQIASIESYPAAVKVAQDEVTSGLKLAKDSPNDVAIIVGIDQYKSLPHAAYAEEDASAFYSYALIRLGIPPSRVVRLTGSAATRNEIAKYLQEWLPKNARPDSRVYVFFSGHGAPEPDTGRTFILPWDADGEYLASTGFNLRNVVEGLSELPSREVVVFLDACFSGTGPRSFLREGLRPLVQVSLPRPPRGSRVTILTASQGNQTAGSWPAKRHGLFTYFLLSGLRRDPPPSGLTVSDLYGFVRQGVEEKARAENRSQSPTLETSTPGLRLF